MIFVDIAKYKNFSRIMSKNRLPVEYKTIRGTKDE